MISSQIFFIGASGLFDFDLTFPAEAFLFILLAIVVTFGFIAPISKKINEREQFINYNLRKSNILVSLGYEKIFQSVSVLKEEIDELNRQIRLVKDYTNLKFEEEITTIQNKSVKLLSELKGDLSIQSAYLLSNIREDLVSLTDAFFVKKFQ